MSEFTFEQLEFARRETAKPLEDEITRLRADVERLTRDRDYWQNLRALPAERKLAMAVGIIKPFLKAAHITVTKPHLDKATAFVAELEKADG